MDIDSDDSERWEDFFGSSTDLTPSLLGIYDSLTTHLDADQQVRNSQSDISLISKPNHSLTQHNGEKDESHETEKNLLTTKSQSSLTSGNSHKSASSQSLSSLSSVSSIAASKPRNNIRVLSPNVQRIITHSDAEPVDSVDMYAIHQQQQQSVQQSPVLPQRFIKKSSPAPTGGHKVKLSHIPLSKTTGKLTQSGSELVETFDSSSEYLDALSFSHVDKQQRNSVSKKTTPSTLTTEQDLVRKVDSETGTKVESVTLPKSLKLSLPKQQSLKLIEMEQLDTATQQPTLLQNYNAKEFVATEPLDAMEMVDAINFSLVSKRIAELTMTDSEALMKKSYVCHKINGNGDELIEAINKPLINKPLTRSLSAACASTISGLPLATYARSKSLAAKANTISGPMPIKLPTAQQLLELEEANKLSAESLDRLSDIRSKYSTKDSRKISCLMLPEISKLKHRPLSSSSICSTSSSSSSGSDQLNSKLTTSYLASVESLADQSENELLDPHSGMSVFGRACMEIVDSERSYVADLGQVIRGYLLDWKERACLSIDELSVLFSNIEEIYEFNITLLKQLIYSGMDPVKIAKCFIDFRDRFNVYTTYCTSYPEAISLLTRLLQATHTNSLLTSTQKMLQHTLPLGSYLLKPVQRILKYHLLLDNLRKHCDIKEVFQAHEIMRQVARNIDQVKRKLEQQSRVKELSGILDGWLGPELTVLGELRQEGIVMEHNKPRMVFLFDTMLIITKPKEDNRLQFKSYIHQNNLMLSEHLPGEPTSFYVIPYDEPRQQIKLTAKNRDQKRLWAQLIKGVILEKFDNIPMRARELVYKLGDEEDRTPDKNTWKWSLHSTSTPVYLERRNQYRRSEMRNRSKIKRKTLPISSSFESFNEAAELTNDSGPTAADNEILTRNHSMDDNEFPAPHNLSSDSVSSKTQDILNVDENVAKLDKDCNYIYDSECKYILRDNRSNAKSSLFGGKSSKSRSKSVPRISFLTEDCEDERHSVHGSSVELHKSKTNSTKPVEIKQYSSKTMPKRIATLKKQRNSKKETSKFYMDLSEFDANNKTILKITESTENLILSNESKLLTDSTETVVTDGKCDNSIKEDAQIILDLLKNSKEFERLYKKSQKKRSDDDGTPTTKKSEPRAGNLERELPPRPPSRSPPPLDSESEDQRDSVQINDEQEEPIYETLLRNVHVPYKFSPILGRSNSTTYQKPGPRPESDYVTLVYSAEGTLQRVGDDVVDQDLMPICSIDQIMNKDIRDLKKQMQRDSSSSTNSSCSTLKRDSQSTIIGFEMPSSSENLSQISPPCTPTVSNVRSMPNNLMKRLLGSATLKSECKTSAENLNSTEFTQSVRGRKSLDNSALSIGRNNKIYERRVSDVSEMCRQGIIHRQGSESVGERMAHIDYADPRTLFNIMPASLNGSSTPTNSSLQRDSVFSLTSSNDSVCEGSRSAGSYHGNRGDCGKFEYEDNVEASLENDFRDSAIYSDDNDKRPDSSSFVKYPSSPLPASSVTLTRHHPQLPPKPTIRQTSTSHKSLPAEAKSVRKSLTGIGGGGSVIICPAHMNPSASRSWVLQQIENFNK